MEWKDVGNAVAGAAPSIAGAIAGMFAGPQAGNLASTGISALLGVLGLKPDAKPDDVLVAIQADPQAALKLKLAENDFKIRQRELDIEELKAELADIQSARTREIEITKTTGRRDSLQFSLAVAGWLAPVFLIFWLLVKGLPSGMSADAAALVGGFLGIIISEYKTIYQYFFGSSKGSEHKTELLARKS